MKRVCLIFLSIFLCTVAFGANVRSSNTTSRQESQRNQIARQTTNRSKKTVTNRSAVSRTQTTQKNTITRNAVKRVSARTVTDTKNTTHKIAKNNSRTSRATTTSQIQTQTFGNNYTTCRDAYFTCMDQFCANQNDTYRRCVCSSRLQKIQEQERLLSQTSTSLQDFHTFNIDAIPKTAAEVMAMQTATDGEKSIKQDKSTSAINLSNIKDVLNTTKQNTQSNLGTLDIAGDIKQIWKTTDLIRGSDIADLSGEALYNAVNAQCYEMVSSQCASSDLKMVASAYGMYIENDCEILASNINTKTTNANTDIRKTRHEMQDARLENYNAHNALSLNECVVQIKQDLTADTACGSGYIHCLDFTGKYLNIDTGEPIYSPDFYQLEKQISLSGDILKNSDNKIFINMLNKKQKFAQQTLDSCRDVADSAWDEFMRQTLIEISQAQQQRVQTVKHDCLQVVNQCYLNKSDTLKEFANDTSTISTRYTIELAETMCAEKLNTCSNLYGGGSNGLDLLVSTMAQITDTTIAQECPVLLDTYVKKLCAVPSNDSIHSYPYGCRTFAPGEAQYARFNECNLPNLTNPFVSSSIAINQIYNKYMNCPIKNKQYIKCNLGYYLCNNEYQYVNTPYGAIACCVCPSGKWCEGGTEGPADYTDGGNSWRCGADYVGSLYQALAIYASNNCTRTTTGNKNLPESILKDISKIMTNVRVALVQELSKECERLNGIWVDLPWTDANSDGYHDTTGDKLFISFHTSTGANKQWGYCKQP